MSANISAPSIEAYRYGWETYANQQVSEIHKMSPEERKQSIDRLRLACASKGLPWEDAKSTMQYPGGMTEKELELRAALQTYFDPLSADVLQSHFTHFYRKGRIITTVAESATEDSKREQLNCNGKANRLIVDELGKSLLRKGIQPQLPPAAAQQKV
ncbi:MAG: hypothetical protein JSS10_06470 [Verrucomicrobia bacterium]|nr:hypothetical protein [Verrucomicrobiota bacterium]